MTETFTPPGPGAWELERTHITKPVSMLMAEIFPPAMMRGFSESTRYYGVLLDRLEIAVINRFVYIAPRPAGAPKSAKGPPPRAVFALLQRLHPELRRRIRRSEEIFRTRAWRDEVRRWNEEVKPAIVAESRALLSEDIAGMPMAALIDHVRRALDFLSRTTYWHHRFNCCSMIPTGDFVAHVTEWTGMPPAEILQALRGNSPVSAGATSELTALRAAVRADAEAMALLASSAPAAQVLDRLRARPAPAGPAAAAYLDLVGLRILGGYDISDRHAHEHPEMLLNIIRSAVQQDDPARKADAEQAVARIRDTVPAERRGMFDELLQEARLTYRTRDERIFYGDALGAGLARRAVLEAGTRLAREGRLEDPEHLVEAGQAELFALLAGAAAPSAAELAARARFRVETPIDAAPDRLGFPPSPPPPAEWLPPGAARLHRAFDTLMGLMFAARDEKPSGKTLKGFSASPGVYEGPARVIDEIAQLPFVQKGEVLVTRSTGPTFNVVLPLIGAIVTERGGALSHAAIVAREYGLPAVVGCGGATGAMRTGTRVRVDGGKGEVWILD